jgi:hypothetical protein
MRHVPQCSREADVVAAVRAGRWPGQADDGLRAHVATCVVCEDVAGVAVIFEALEAEAAATGTLPVAGQVWWRARVRARAEAARRAARPVLAAQALAAACAVGLVAAVLSYLLPSMTRTAGALLAPIASMEFGAVAYAVVGAWLILAPVAVYFAVARE